MIIPKVGNSESVPQLSNTVCDVDEVVSYKLSDQVKFEYRAASYT